MQLTTVPSGLIKFLVMMSIVVHIEAGTIPSHPDYISVIGANKVLAILKKSTMAEEGFPVWNTPDNKTVKISMNSVEIPAYNIKVYKWVLSLNYNKINLILESPAPPPVRSPHLVNWFHKDKSAANFRFEKSEEKEYNDMYYELRQPARQKTKQEVGSVQPGDLVAGPLYLRIRKAGEEKAWTVLRKSDVLNNGASMWQTPDDKKSVQIVFNTLKNRALVWQLKMKVETNTVGLVGVLESPNQYPQTVKWYSFTKPENGWTVDGTLIIEESNKEEYKEVQVKTSKQQQQQQQPQLQEGGILELAKPLIFGMGSRFTPMAVGVVLSKAGVIGGVGNMGTGVFNTVGGIGSGALHGVGQTADGLFTETSKVMQSGLSMLGMDNLGSGIQTGVSALGTGISTFGQGLGSGLSELTSGLGDGSKQFAGSLDSFFNGDIVGVIGGLSTGVGSIADGALGSVTSVGTSVLDGTGKIVGGALAGIGHTAGGIFSDVGNGIGSISNFGRGAIGTVTHTASNAVNGVAKAGKTVVRSFTKVFDWGK